MFKPSLYPAERYMALFIGALAASAALIESKAAALALVLIPLAGIAGVWLLAGPERWIPLFFCAAVLLPPLPLPLGNSGPHPAMGLALVGLLMGLAYYRDWRFRIHSLNVALLTLTAVIFCSVGLAAAYSGAAIALGSLARASLFAIAVYVFFYTQCGPGRDRGLSLFVEVRFLFAIASAAALLACLDFYYQLPAPAGFSPQFVWLDSGIFRRAQGLFYEASTLGNFCAFFLTMIAVSIFRPANQRPVALPFMIGGGVVLVLAVVLSYSRASVVNLLVSCAALWAIRRKHSSLWRPALAMAGSCAAAGWACYALAPDLFWAYRSRLQNSVVDSFSSTNGVLSGRVDSWDAILGFLAAHPWHLLAGVGYKTLPYSYFTGAPLIVDNAFLSALAETGLMGLAALLFFLFAVLRMAYRAARSDDTERSFFGAWTFCFWCGQIAQMFSGDLFTYWRVLPIYFWVLAVAVR